MKYVAVMSKTEDGYILNALTMDMNDIVPVYSNRVKCYGENKAAALGDFYTLSALLEAGDYNKFEEVRNEY